MTNTMNKKGLSDVVTNVLIILLVIVAIGIIAAFIMPLINRSTSQAGEGVSCLSVNVAPSACAVNSTSNQTKLTITRGSGVYDITDIKYIFEKADGSTDIKALNVTQRARITEFGTAVLDVNGTTSDYKPSSISLVVQLSGSRAGCPQTNEVTCTYFN